MKKLFFSILMLAASTAAVNAQLLWKVSGNGAKGNSYLLGTHHVAPVSMLDSIKGFNAALAEVDAVGGEIEMTDMAAQAQLSMQYMMAPADSLLTMVLTPAQADSVGSILAKHMGDQVNISMFAPLKPAAVSTQLALLETMATMPPEVAQAIALGQQLDSQVQKLGEAAGKKPFAMETAEQQLQLLMGNPIAEQARDLMQAVREILSGKSAKKVKELTDAYMSQNMEAIEKVMFDGEQMTESELKRLITDRNTAWVAKLIEIMPNESVLLAVGTGHLPGPDGLIEQLRKAGYKVEPYAD
ncbi:MAG: TraB/GumN family protein [Muribaculaceae bacterium]|nr:TraB/GumN family protein [Muribaculaceae bacterium]